MPAPANAQPSSRILSIDVLRGLTIAAMILVTDPGTYSAVYWPLLHAQWANPTPTDLIFPSFLMMTGASIPFSFASRRRAGETDSRLAWHVLRRCLTLIVLGLILNAFPAFDLHNLRIPGILQRIAVCYAMASALYLFIRPVRTRVFVLTLTALLILIGYWALLRFGSVPGFGAARYDSFGSWPAYIDRCIFSLNHLWPYGTTPGHGVTFDPEGVLSTFPALATLLFGTLAGECLRSGMAAQRKVLTLLASGVLSLALSLAWKPWFPVAKKIWTSSFALWSGGILLIFLALCYFIVDMKQKRRGHTPALMFGTNPIVAFTISTIITSLGSFLRIHSAGRETRLNDWVYQHWFLPWATPVNASLFYAFAVVALNLAFVYPLYRKRIFIRV